MRCGPFIISGSPRKMFTRFAGCDVGGTLDEDRTMIRGPEEKLDSCGQPERYRSGLSGAIGFVVSRLSRLPRKNVAEPQLITAMLLSGDFIRIESHFTTNRVFTVEEQIAIAALLFTGEFKYQKRKTTRLVVADAHAIVTATGPTAASMGRPIRHRLGGNGIFP